MSFQGNYLFIVSMDVAPEKEALFNEVYDTEHIPYLMKVPGVIAVSRTVKQPLAFMLGGTLTPVDTEAEPKYTAIYEITGPDVMKSEAWAEAVEKGRWPGEVRPHTFNRRHVLQKVHVPA